MKLARRKQLYLDDEMEKQVSALAQREDRSLDGQLRRLIRIGLEHAAENEGQEGGAPMLSGKRTDTTHLRLDPGMVKRIRELADKDCRSTQHEIVYLLGLGLEARESKAASDGGLR